MKDDAEHGQEIVQLTMLDELPLAGTQQSVRVTEGFAHLYVCLHDKAGRLGLPHYIATLRPGDIAIAMLQEEHYALSEIAFLPGYSAQSAFNRAFKRWTGVTPAAYRKTKA